MQAGEMIQGHRWSPESQGDWAGEAPSGDPSFGAPPRQVNDVIMKALHSNEVSSKPGMSPRLGKVGMGRGGVGMNSCSRPRVRSQAGCLPWAVGKSDWWCQGLAGRSCPQHVGIHNATAVCHGGCRCTGVKEKPC